MLIFVSYSRQDYYQIKTIIEAIDSKDYQIWIDKEGIDGATFWRKEIVEAIKESGAILFFASSSSCKSDNVFKEIALANEEEKIIIPVFIDDATLPSELRYQLSGLQYIYYTEPPYKAIEQILTALSKIIKKQKNNVFSLDKNSSQHIEYNDKWIGILAWIGILIVCLLIICLPMLLSQDQDGSSSSYNIHQELFNQG